MICLHPPPLLLTRQQVVSLSQSSCVPSVEFTDGRERGRGGEGRGKELNHTTARKPGPLYSLLLSVLNWRVTWKAKSVLSRTILPFEIRLRPRCTVSMRLCLKASNWPNKQLHYYPRRITYYGKSSLKVEIRMTQKNFSLKTKNIKIRTQICLKLFK